MLCSGGKQTQCYQRTPIKEEMASAMHTHTALHSPFSCACWVGIRACMGPCRNISDWVLWPSGNEVVQGALKGGAQSDCIGCSALKPILCTVQAQTDWSYGCAEPLRIMTPCSCLAKREENCSHLVSMPSWTLNQHLSACFFTHLPLDKLGHWTT